MAIKSSDQISIIDVTDGHSVNLTSDSHTFPGGTSAALAGSVTTQIIAMRGSEQVNASVIVSEITKPSGVTVSSDGDTTAPTLTIEVTTSVTVGGIIKIPVHIGDITIVKEFSFAIAFKGATGQTGATGNGISKIETFYLTTSKSSGVTTSTSGWSTTPTATTTTNKYIWSYQKTTYTNGNTESSTPAIIGTHGATGSTGNTGATGNGISKIETFYLTTSKSSGVTTSTSGWSTTPTATTTTNKYIWSYQKTTYTNGSTESSTPAIIGTHGATGATGAAGADAITLSITSSNGTIFKNSAIATVLTAHVYKAGIELTATQIAALGTIKWYKDGSTTACGTGATLTIDAGDVTNKATYIAQLEG